MALLALRDEAVVQGAHVVAVVSEEVCEQGVFETFRQGVEALGLDISVEPVSVPSLRTGHLDEIIWAVEEGVGVGTRLLVDVTQGLRHVQLGMLALTLYLAALRPRTELAGIYYGAHELRGHGDWPKDVAPLLRLDALLDAFEWYAALRMAREAGNFRVFTRLLNSQVGRAFRLGRGGEPPYDLGRLNHPLESLSHALGAGLPLEVGMAAARAEALAHTALREARRQSVPLGRLALEALLDTTVGLASQQDSADKGDRVLDRAELERQLNLGARYAEWHREAAATRVLREWLVNWALWARGESEGWLDVGRRNAAAHALGVLSERAKEGLADEAQRQVGSLWGKVSKRRNTLAHGGFSSELIREDPHSVRQWLNEAHALLDASWPDVPRADHTVLFTPLGLSPGVLYSALLHCRPAEVWVFTSEQGRALAGEAFERAGFGGISHLVEVDPFAFGALPWKQDEGLAVRLREAVGAATEIVVNITGGTTALQYLVERAADFARRITDLPVERIALVDRRRPEEQRREPYVLGELLRLSRD